MPLYEYQCDACGKRFEVIQKFSDPPADACRTCGGGPVRRLASSPAIQFKGTGWYITDYSQKGKPAQGSSDGGKDAAGTDGAGKGGDASKDATPAKAEGSSGSSDSATKPAAPAAAPKAS